MTVLSRRLADAGKSLYYSIHRKRVEMSKSQKIAKSSNLG